MIEHGENNFEHLLNKKPFDELSSEEKEDVLKFLSEEEYIQYQLLLQRSVSALNSESQDLYLNPSIAKDLREAFKAKHNKKLLHHISFKDFTFQSPAFRPAIAVVIILFSVFLIINYSGKKPQQRIQLSENKEKHNPPAEPKKVTVKKDLETISFHSSAKKGRKEKASPGIAQHKEPLEIVSIAQIETTNPLCSDINIVSEQSDENVLYSSALNPIGMNERLLLPY